MSTYEIAQLNVGVLKDAIDSPAMATFSSGLDRINALAESTSGFIWRLQNESEEDAAAIRSFGSPHMLVNLSIWRDVDALSTDVYRSAHVEFMRRRREWFEPMTEASLVLWWLPAGHRPSVTQAVERLQLLRARGPTAQAFTFRHPFTPSGAVASKESHSPMAPAARPFAQD